LAAEFPVVSLRILLSPDTEIGPGKAQLLQYISETGSIAAASRKMGMSYKRAWYLIDTMNVLRAVAKSANGAAPLTGRSSASGDSRLS
jgi:molybdate transport repressor ModE-like protein